MRRMILLMMVILLSVNLGVKAEGGKEITDKKKSFFLIPDYARVQFAGQAGMFSLGAGYTFVDRLFFLDVFYGYAPKENHYNEYHTAGVKLTYAPRITRDLIMKGKLFPFIGLSFNFAIGDGNKTFVNLPSYFPDHYYAPTSIRICPSFGLAYEMDNKVMKKAFDKVQFYFEGVTNSVYLDYFLQNKNVGLNDIFSLSLGVKMFIRN